MVRALCVSEMRSQLWLALEICRLLSPLLSLTVLDYDVAFSFQHKRLNLNP
jgi:hypothetical protein